MEENECKKCVLCRSCQNVTANCYKGEIDFISKRNGSGEVTKYIELVLRFFEKNAKKENILDLNIFSLGALRISAVAKERAKLNKTNTLNNKKTLRILAGFPDIVETSIIKRKVTKNGELNIGVSMHDLLKYSDYDLMLNLTGFQSYDKKSDKILKLNRTNNFIIINSGDSVPEVAGVLGSTKDSISAASELAGLALIASNPATAGVFIQLNQVVKLIDKIRFLNIVFGKNLSSFVDLLSGFDRTKEIKNPNKDKHNRITAKYGKLTKYKAQYVLDLGTYIKVNVFLLLFFLRFLVYKMRNNLLNLDGKIIK